MKKNRFFQKLKKLITIIRNKLSPPVNFLASGRLGGIILMILLVAQFDIAKAMFDLPFPRTVTFLISAVISVLLAEILGLIVRLFFGGGKRSKLYFFTAWLEICVANFLGVQLNLILSPIVMSFFLVLSVDILGRCVVAFIRQRRFKHIFSMVWVFIQRMVM